MKTALMRLIALGVAGLVLATPVAVRAEDDDGDHDRARELFEHGEIEGLADILAVVRAKAPGDIVAVDLIRVGSRWVYRFQVVGVDGRRRIVDVDAGAGVVMHGEGGNL